MRDAIRAAAGISFLAGVLTATSALAAFSVDDNNGRAFDDYYDGNSIDNAPGASSGYSQNVYTGTLTVATPGTPAVIVTRPVAPSSFSAWTKVQLKGSFPSISRVHVAFLAADGTPIPGAPAT
ncbi:MAG: hypothetical protein KC635_18975, partial [Myxococcales bacterium]|nr:hypothetical protein [Myxococcales bacterium]